MKNFPSAKLLLSLKTPGKRKRLLSPIDAAKEIEEGMNSLRESGFKGSSAEVAKMLDLNADKMVVELVSLLKLPETVHSIVGWEGRRAGLIGPDTGYIISQLESSVDMENLAKLVVESDLDRKEIRSIVQLKNRNQDLSLDDAIEKILKIRPIEKPGYIVVTDIEQDVYDALRHLASQRNQQLQDLIPNLVSEEIGLEQITGTKIRNNIVIMTLRKEGYDRFRTIERDLGVLPEDVLQSILKNKLKIKE